MFSALACLKLTVTLAMVREKNVLILIVCIYAHFIQEYILYIYININIYE
jgi:hypothetical protein